MTDVSTTDSYIWRKSSSGATLSLVPKDTDISSLATESNNSYKIRRLGWWGDIKSEYSDMNNININGCANTIGGVYTNLPSDSDGWGTLHCFTTGSDILQFYVGWNAGQLWYRMSHQDYGNWSSWYNINDTINKAQDALNRVVALESKFNNLFTQSGNTLTINY